MKPEKEAFTGVIEPFSGEFNEISGLYRQAVILLCHSANVHCLGNTY